MAVQSDFIAAVNQIAAERNIDADEVLEAVAEAIRSGFESNYPVESEVDIKVNIDREEGQISVVHTYEVVEEVEDENNQIELEDARVKYGEDLDVGDIVEVDITPEGDFGRVAAQAAKQVILQKVRESERNAQLAQYEDKLGEVEFAVVQRMDRDRVLWEVGRTLAVMKPEDRIPGEFYKSGTRHKVLLKSIEETPRGRTLFISRSSEDFLRALFELEVPELESESVEIKGIAREAGSRSKVAVHSSVDGIDPIGSFVGQRGVRITSVMNELKVSQDREEKIDIILWDEDEEEFLKNAISPAEAVEVRIIDEEERHAEIVIPEDQLSLAIGREGQNVRLAAKLTGWKIDVVSADSGEVVSGGDKEGEVEGEATSEESVEDEDTEVEAEAEKAGDAVATAIQAASDDSKDDSTGAGTAGNDLDDVAVLSTRTVNALKAAGINTMQELEDYSGEYSEIDGIGPASVEEIEKALA
jgi:N utilization substance protein A